jgi:hypothetical protein
MVAPVVSPFPCVRSDVMLRLDLILFRPFRFWLEELIGFAFGFAMVFFLCENRHSSEQLLWLPNMKCSKNNLRSIWFSENYCTLMKNRSKTPEPPLKKWEGGIF